MSTHSSQISHQYHQLPANTLPRTERSSIYPKSTTQPRLMDLLHPKSTTLPLCLLTTDQFSELTLLSPHSKNPSQQYHQFPACTLQRTNPPAPSFARSPSSLLKQQHLPESGILLRTIRAYRSKRRVVTSSSFQN